MSLFFIQLQKKLKGLYLNKNLNNVNYNIYRVILFIFFTIIPMLHTPLVLSYLSNNDSITNKAIIIASSIFWLFLCLLPPLAMILIANNFKFANYDEKKKLVITRNETYAGLVYVLAIMIIINSVLQNYFNGIVAFVLLIILMFYLNKKSNILKTNVSNHISIMPFPLNHIVKYLTKK